MLWAICVRSCSADGPDQAALRVYVEKVRRDGNVKGRVCSTVQHTHESVALTSESQAP